MEKKLIFLLFVIFFTALFLPIYPLIIAFRGEEVDDPVVMNATTSTRLSPYENDTLVDEPEVLNATKYTSFSPDKNDTLATEEGINWEIPEYKAFHRGKWVDAILSTILLRKKFSGKPMFVFNFKGVETAFFSEKGDF